MFGLKELILMRCSKSMNQRKPGWLLRKISANPSVYENLSFTSLLVTYFNPCTIRWCRWDVDVLQRILRTAFVHVHRVSSILRENAKCGVCAGNYIRVFIAVEHKFTSNGHIQHDILLRSCESVICELYFGDSKLAVQDFRFHRNM